MILWYESDLLDEHVLKGLVRTIRAMSDFAEPYKRVISLPCGCSDPLKGLEGCYISSAHPPDQLNNVIPG